MSYRKKACDLDVGDRIVIPPTLLPTNAIITKLTPVPARGGAVLMASVEFDFGAVKGIKSDFVFRTDDERVDYIPVKRHWAQKLFYPITFWLY